MPELSENATLIERLQYYVNFDNPKKARALARVADFLEEYNARKEERNQRV